MRGNGTAHLAGWLFADLLLILVLVVLGGQTSRAGDTAGPRSTPTRPVTPSSTPSATAEIGMVPKSLDLPLLVDQNVADDLVHGSEAAKAAAARRVNAAVDRELAHEKRLGAMVFVWGSDGGCRGCSPTKDDSNAYAEAAANAIQQGRHRLLPRDPVFYRGYIDLGTASGTLRMELFVYNS